MQYLICLDEYVKHKKPLTNRNKNINCVSDIVETELLCTEWVNNFEPIFKLELCT